MEWFERWFNEEYLCLYRHRNFEEADVQVNFVLKALGSIPALVCDVGCGSGRHISVFKDQAILSVGVDLSAILLKAAKPELNLVQGDMRALPLQDASVSLLTSFFTSFGYLPSEADEVKVLNEFRRVLKVNGTLFLDVANGPYIQRTLQEHSEETLPIGKVSIGRKIEKINDRLRVKKSIQITKQSGSSHSFTEDVRLFTAEELEDLARESGFTKCKVFGDFSGSVHTQDSPRIVMFLEQQ